jgi:methylthioribose-1-phosphate isomerase
VQVVNWADGRVELVDQRQLPNRVKILKLKDHKGVAAAIKEMAVRGAPAIGVASAYGIVLGAKNLKDEKHLDEKFASIVEELSRTRPTAVNLFWAIARMKEIFEKHRHEGLRKLQQALLAEAHRIKQEGLEADKRLSRNGAKLIKEGDAILTHCNTGALATAEYGTALGIIKAAWQQGKRIKVLVAETRPLLQGLRLTAWELAQEGIPFEIIVDNAAGSLMQRGEVSRVIVGADRIAANGDVANKIGTYSLAVLAHHHKIPFYVAAPTSTIDPSLKDGSGISIEEREPKEVTHIQGIKLAPRGAKARNPAFDITPRFLITAIITERGIFRPARAIGKLA